MTVLVTGGAGYIGSHMVHALADAGERVVVLDNLSTGFDWAVAKGVPLVVGDTGDQPLVSRLIAEHEVSEIIHFAASIVVPDSVADPLGYYRNNTSNSRSLIECAVKGGVKRFIFSSTAAVYGDPATIPIGEDGPTCPMSPYGSSKLMTEIMLRDAGIAHGLDSVILRYFNVAGADPQLRTGQSTAGATHLIKVAVECALGKRSKIDVLRHRLPDPRRHLSARLHPRHRSRPRPFGCARLSARGRPAGDAQLRLRPRLLGARGDRYGQAGVGRRFPRRPCRRDAPAIRRGSWRNPTASARRSAGGRNSTTSRPSSAMRWPGSAPCRAGRGALGRAAPRRARRRRPAPRKRAAVMH